VALPALENCTIGVIGLGYVGLPLAVAFGARQPVVGFDVNSERVEQLQQSSDITGETSSEQLLGAKQLHVTNDEGQLDHCEVFIVTVPECWY